MVRVLGGAASLVAIGSALVIGSTSALAYQSGTIGYDISYPQCGTTYPANIRIGAPPVVTPHVQSVTVRPLAQVTRTPRIAAADSTPPRAVPQSSAPATSRLVAPAVAARHPAFGIIGVDSGNPFISATHPGNPCLADEYAHAPNPALYVNTGYDPIYEDSNHTTLDCTTRSQNLLFDAAHQRAWAVGCSEAQKDLAYVASKGIVNKGGWWLDVETGNSWCGLYGVSCDKSFNAYSIQGLIDTLLSNNASPVGIYSNNYMWSVIVGTNTVHGQVADWYATGKSTAQAAAPYCASAYSFTGDPVRLAQFVSGSIDRDLAC